MSELLYHYCNTDVFFNIIKNSTIWLSDVSKSNDYQECVLCLDLVNREMEKFFSSYSPKIGQMSCFSLSKLIILGFY